MDFSDVRFGARVGVFNHDKTEAVFGVITGLEHQHAGPYVKVMTWDGREPLLFPLDQVVLVDEVDLALKEVPLSGRFGFTPDEAIEHTAQSAAIAIQQAVNSESRGASKMQIEQERLVSFALLAIATIQRHRESERPARRVPGLHA